MNSRKLVSEFERVFKHSQEAVIRYLTAEIQFLMKHLSQRPKPTDSEKAILARGAKAVDPVYLEKTFNLFTPATLYRWHREMVRKKWDYSKLNPKPGRPRIDRELETWIVKLALENPQDGYKTIVGKLKTLGFETNIETVQNILKRNGITPAPDRKDQLTWNEFLEMNWENLTATDFLTWEVLTPFGLATYYILLFIRLKDRKVHIAGVTTNPNGDWMKQIARNLTTPDGCLKPGQILIHDRGGQYCPAFKRVLEESGVKTMAIPPRSPNLNAYAERWVRTVKEQCLKRLIITSEEMLRKALKEYVEFYHHERCHQGIGNVIPFPNVKDNVGSKEGKIVKKSRLGRLLNYYHREQKPYATIVSA
jgi:putative transposase